MATITPNLEVGMTEVFGPKTNQKTIAVLGPDMYTKDADAGRLAQITRAASRSTWMAGDNAGQNLVGKDNVAVTVTAANSAYLVAEAALFDAPMSAIWS